MVGIREVVQGVVSGSPVRAKLLLHPAVRTTHRSWFEPKTSSRDASR
jgi:hypothetical protein